MAQVSRQEHMELCKKNALRELHREGGDSASAITTLIADMKEHPETARVVEDMAMILVFEASKSKTEVETFIKGFN